jgi:hypothetical protein
MDFVHPREMKMVAVSKVGSAAGSVVGPALADSVALRSGGRRPTSRVAASTARR